MTNYRSYSLLFSIEIPSIVLEDFAAPMADYRWLSETNIEGENPAQKQIYLHLESFFLGSGYIFAWRVTISAGNPAIKGQVVAERKSIIGDRAYWCANFTLQFYLYMYTHIGTRKSSSLAIARTTEINTSHTGHYK